MNHFKTFIFAIFLATYMAYWPALGQLERPLRAFEIQQLVKNIEKDPSNVKSRLFLANHYYGQNQWQKVIEYIGPVAEKLPDREIHRLAESYLNVGDYRQSEAIGNILMSRSQVKTNSYLLAVEIYSRILDKAENLDFKKSVQSKLFETLKTAQAKDPENPKVYDLWLEKLEQHVEHYAFDALRVMEDLKKNKIRLTPRLQSLTCRYNFLAKFTKETKLTCRKAIVVDPDNPSNYIYLGQTHVNIGEEKLGKRMLASVGKKFSESGEALLAAARSYDESGNISAAYTYYQKAAKTKNASPDAYMGLAETAFQLKKYGEALQAYSRHCYVERRLHHNFRRASGLLKDEPQWHELYRQRMMDCKPSSAN